MEMLSLMSKELDVFDVIDVRRQIVLSKVMIKELDSCDLYEEDMKPLMIRIEGISMIRLVISIKDELHIQDEGIQ